MKQVNIDRLKLWQFEQLAGEPRIRHFVTDRSSGGDYEFTLSLSSTPDREFVKANRHLLAKALGISEAQLFLPSQVHGTKVVYVTPEIERSQLMDTDALITDHSNVCIAVMSADCVPILLYDRRNHAVGAVHSGWKGTVARILSKTLEEMAAKFGTRGEDLFAAIGPSVSQDAYEVGEEVVLAVSTAFGNDNSLMIRQPNNKAKLDLWEANRIQLLEFGVAESNIETGALCTVRNNNHFFSARKGDKGRFAAGIMLA
jgi:polyphenol oxidase